MKTKFTTLFLAVLLFSSHSYANEEGAFLSSPFKNHNHPIKDDFSQKSLSIRSNTLSVIKNMSQVKSQGSRGTCSIFSAAAMVEGLLAIAGFANSSIDLSEEWLEYLNIASTRSTTDGSFTSRNFRLMRSNGMAFETTLPYESENWEKMDNSLELQRCQGLVSSEKTMCELGHFNPNFYRMSDKAISQSAGGERFLQAKEEALINKEKFPKFKGQYSINSVSEIKSRLELGVPVVLDITFFYGAWNHRKADELGIGRDLNLWANGVVSYPERQSLDYKLSMENRAGHSVLLVGFDNEKEVKTTVKMRDGSTKTFTYKGVYYFKNSWGTNSFGSQTMIEGESHQGYGVITQKYAHDYGSFYKLDMY